MTRIDAVMLRKAIASRMGHSRAVTYRFEPGVNVLCGPNGSGKSTLLTALFPGERSPFDKGIILPDAKKNVRRTVSKNGGVFYFDFELDGPRAKSFGHELNMGNLDKARAAFAASNMSHGQATRKTAESFFTSKTKGACVLLDEPEQALDPDGILYLRRALKKAGRHTQFIIATHSPFLLFEPGFHVVELSPGYLKHMKAVYRTLYV